MTDMTLQHQNVAESLEKAWQDKDMVALRSCLAAGTIEWYEDAFEMPITNAQKIIERWERDLANQNHLVATVSLLDAIEERGYYASTAKWIDQNGKTFELDGVFIIRLNSGGKIIYFGQWWDRK